MCRACNTKPVYISKINKKKYCKSCFNKYFEKKVRKTLRVNNLIQKTDKLTIKGINQQLLFFLLNKIIRNIKITKQINKADKIIIANTIDDEAGQIIKAQIIKTKYTSKPIEKKIIKPLYQMLDKEVLIFAKINKLKFKPKKSKIKTELDKLEQKHPGTKNSIVKSNKLLTNIIKL